MVRTETVSDENTGTRSETEKDWSQKKTDLTYVIRCGSGTGPPTSLGGSHRNLQAFDEQIK